jgi:hypothetical protein
MNNKVVGNYLRAHRRRSGLSQRDLGILAGYKDDIQVSRHERSETVPPLLIALSYEVIFQVPVAELFVGFQSAVANTVAHNAEELTADIEKRSEGRQQAKAISQKLKWLKERRSQ